MDDSLAILLGCTLFLITISLARLIALKLGYSRACTIICFVLTMSFCLVTLSFDITRNIVISLLRPASKSDTIHFAALVVIFFYIGYRTNITLFKYNYLQTLIIGIFGNILFVILLISLLYFIKMYTGKISFHSLLFLSAMCLPYSINFCLEFFEKSPIYTKHIQHLLEVEAFTSIIVTSFAYSYFIFFDGEFQVENLSSSVAQFGRCMLSVALAFIAGMLSRPMFLTNDSVSIFLYTTAALYILLVISHTVLKCQYQYASIAFGMTINKLKHLADKNCEERYQIYWNHLYLIIEISVYVICGIKVSLRKSNIYRDFISAFVIFLLTILLRTILWFLYAIIMKFIFGYRLPFSMTILCIFALDKSSISLLLLNNTITDDTLFINHIEPIVSIYVCLYSTFIYIIFPLLYKYTDLTKFSKKRIKRIEYLNDMINTSKRNAELNIKKALISANANWIAVNKLIEIDRPKFELKYLIKDKRKENLKLNENNEINLLTLKLNYRKSNLPLKFIQSEESFNRKDSDESSEDIMAYRRTDDYVKNKIYKKILEKHLLSYKRQLKEGILSKMVYFYLTKYSEQPRLKRVFQVKKLRLYVPTMYDFFRNNFLLFYEKHNKLFKPNNVLREYVFDLITSCEYRVILTILIYLDSITQILIIFFYFTENELVNLFQMIDYFCYGFFIGVFILHIIGLGFVKYFNEKIWKIEFFVSIIIRTVMHSIIYLQMYSGEIPQHDISKASVFVIYLKLFSILRFQTISQFTSNEFILCIANTIDELKRSHLLRLYEKLYGRSIGYEDLLGIYHNVFGITIAGKEVCKQWINKRLLNRRMMQLLDARSRGLTIAMHSKYVAFQVLNNTVQVMVRLQRDGFVHEHEKLIFQYSLNKIKIELRKLNFVKHPNPQMLFKNIYWLKGDFTCRHYFLKHARAQIFHKDQYIITYGDQMTDLHLITSGICKYTYKGDSHSLYRMILKGILPNSDYYLHLQFHQVQRDLLTAGNLIGEYGLITGRPYNMQVICETTVTTLTVPFKSILKQFYRCHFGRFRITKLWKTIGIRFSIKHFQLYFKILSRENLMIRLHNSIVPILEQATMITIIDSISDVILIEGSVIDALTRCELLAPLHITARNQTYILNKHLNIYEVPPRLMLVPKKGVNRQELLESYDLINNYLIQTKITPKFIGLDTCIKKPGKHKIINNFIKNNTYYLIHDFILQENDPKIFIPCCFNEKKPGKKKKLKMKEYLHQNERFRTNNENIGN